jgi:hypothetical protein
MYRHRTETERLVFDERAKIMRRKSQMDPKSNRTRKRKARNFVSLETSSRKHRRAFKRHDISCTVAGHKRNPGEVVQGPNTFSYRAGGAFDYHSS